MLKQQFDIEGVKGKVMRLYHMTSKQAASLIVSSQKMIPGSDGMFGGGIYFAETREACLRKARHREVLLQADVEVGLSYVCRTHNRQTDYKRLISQYGLDSVKGVGCVSSPEYVVYNSSQVKNIRIVPSEPLRRVPQNILVQQQAQTSTFNQLKQQGILFQNRRISQQLAQTQQLFQRSQKILLCPPSRKSQNIPLQQRPQFFQNRPISQQLAQTQPSIQRNQNIQLQQRPQFLQNRPISQQLAQTSTFNQLKQQGIQPKLFQNRPISQQLAQTQQPFQRSRKILLCPLGQNSQNIPLQQRPQFFQNRPISQQLAQTQQPFQRNRKILLCPLGSRNQDF